MDAKGEIVKNYIDENGNRMLLLKLPSPAGENITKQIRDISPSEFKGIRLGLNLSQKELGKELGYQPVQISRFETDVTAIPQAVKLAMFWLENVANSDA